MTFMYTDLTRDCLLYYTLMKLITVESLINPIFWGEFSHQILLLLLISIVTPLLAIAFKVGIQEPGILLGYEANRTKKCKTFITLPLALAFSPAIPALLTNVQEIEKENTRQILSTSFFSLGSKLEGAHGRMQFLKFVKKNILFYKEVELVVEVSIQATIQILMILLNQSKTPATRGLNSVFSQSETIDNSTILLILSILWTLKTSLTTYVGLYSVRKDGFMPMKAKLALGLRCFSVISTRILAIVLFFSGFLGLFNLLGHHQMEKIPWSTLSKSSYANVSEVLRYTTENMASTTDYTIIPLKTAYLIFWCILCMQFIVVFIYKNLTSASFKVAKLSTKLWHTFKCLLFPDPFSDWDEDLHDTVEEMEQKFELVMQEITVGSLVHWLFNMINLLPLFVTGKLFYGFIRL